MEARTWQQQFQAWQEQIARRVPRSVLPAVAAGAISLATVFSGPTAASEAAVLNPGQISVTVRADFNRNRFVNCMSGYRDYWNNHVPAWYRVSNDIFGPFVWGFSAGKTPYGVALGLAAQGILKPAAIAYYAMAAQNCWQQAKH